jgi:hypothetical protein
MGDMRNAYLILVEKLFRDVHFECEKEYGRVCKDGSWMKLAQDRAKMASYVIYGRSNFLFWYHSLVVCVVSYS